MTRRRATLILLLVSLVISVSASACKAGHPDKPDLPQSVAPGWTRRSFDAAPPPSGIPAGVKPDCWRADYETSNGGEAKAWVCGYSEPSSAFDAVQRARAEANTVKLQAGRYLALVQWRGVSREEITALVRSLQKSLPGKQD